LSTCFFRVSGAERRQAGASIDSVKLPGSRRPVKKISIRFQSYGASERRRALVRLPKLKVSQDLFDDTGVVDKAEDSQMAAAFRAIQRVCKIHFSNEARPGAAC